MDRIRSREPQTILNQNKSASPSKSRRSIETDRRGFTLIEILLVLGIIVMVTSFGMPVISRISGQRLNSTARQFVGLIRTVRTDAILLNNIYRLTFDFEKNTYTVESQKKLELLSESPIEKKKPNSKEDPPPSNFAIAEKYSKAPRPLPSGLVFDGVLKEREGLIKEGTAYIYFFPNGFNEQAIVYLNNEGSSGKGYSLLIRPTAGRVEIVKNHITDFF